MFGSTWCCLIRFCRWSTYSTRLNTFLSLLFVSRWIWNYFIVRSQLLLLLLILLLCCCHNAVTMVSCCSDSSNHHHHSFVGIKRKCCDFFSFVFLNSRGQLPRIFAHLNRPTISYPLVSAVYDWFLRVPISFKNHAGKGIVYVHDRWNISELWTIRPLSSSLHFCLSWALKVVGCVAAIILWTHTPSLTCYGRILHK